MTPLFQNNFPFETQFIPPTLQLCYCFGFRILISQKRNHGKFRSGEKKVRSEECLIYQATFKIISRHFPSIPTWLWWNGVKSFQIYTCFNMFCDIKNCFSAHNWLVFRWFVRYLTGLWVVWLVFGWFYDGFAGLWVVWLVFGQFRALQPMKYI